jgi:hypothetical protein
MKFINLLIGILILTAEALLLYAGYFLFYPFEPVIFNHDRFAVVTKEVKRGGSLIYTADVCKNMEIATEVSRSFNNEITYLLPVTISTKPKGCDITKVAIPIPKELPAGHYFLRTRFTYKINALRTITVTHDTEGFGVIE